MINNKRGEKCKKKMNKVLYSEKKMGQMIEAIFIRYDCNNSDYLSKDQFSRALKRLMEDMGGSQPSQEDVEDVMYQLDANGDGQISKDEFKGLMQSVVRLAGEKMTKAKVAVLNEIDYNV